MSVTYYPVIPTELFCDNYSVKVNGTPVTLNTARVSAVPFNRRWPGHQRPIDQTEIVQFLSLAADEPLTFEITPKEKFDGVKLRPRSLGVTPEITADGRIVFTLPRPAYFTVEPYGRRHALHLFVDPMPHYDVDFNDESVIYFGAGEHDVGTIRLTSGQTLFIDEGAVVYACVRAIDAENVKILGRGILDNSRNTETILYEEHAEGNESAVNNAVREHTVQLEYCEHVVIDGITIRDSLVYNIRPIGCSDLRIRNVKIIGCWRYNSDGIDMHNCTDVHISDCFLRTFDDSICVKGFDCYYDGDVEAAVQNAMYRNGKKYDVFRDALIENCVIWNDWGKALEIGAETRAEEIRTVTFRKCDLIHLTGPALDCMNVDYADVHEIRFEDIHIEYDETIPAPVIQRTDAEVYENPNHEYMPCTISARVTFHHEYSAGGTRRGRNREMVFKNIRVTGEKTPRLRFAGYDAEHKTENVLITNLYLNGTPIERSEDVLLEIGDFTENIRFEADPYSQMSQNTVDSANQLKESSLVRFDDADCTGIRVMFVGNSITLHGIRPEVGWYHEWGMAASSKEKDYVHLLEGAIKKEAPDAAFCICHVSDWERSYLTDGRDRFPLYSEARRFGADIIVMRLIENCAKSTYDSEIFLREFDALIAHLNGTGKAQIIITTGFWRHPGDGDLCAYAKKHGYPLVELGDLGEDDRMKAIGLFAHRGVSHHPGDEGMKAIADRIMDAVKGYLK